MKRTIRALALVLVLTLAVCPGAIAVSASTYIYDSTSALRNNIDLAIMSLDGITVWSDDSFSFNDLVGPRTAAYGFEKAVNGRGVTVVGGGVSQVATTLYLALKERGDIAYIDKQVYGSRFTGDYVSSGSDAILTDYKNEIDFSFINEGNSFTIEMWRSGSTVYCSLEDVDDWYDWDDGDWGDYADSYIFPQSSYEYLSRSDVLSIPMSMWGYARNEIYARHGYVFNTARYAAYFENQDWYYPGGFSTSDLNEVEWYNMELIKSMEEEYGATPGDYNPSTSSSGYIFPDSSWKRLTRSEILSIPTSQWGYARNEIYARHGYEFNTAKYRNYFNQKSWYYPGGFSTSDLNEVEWYNMELIKSMEEEYGVD